MLSPSQYPQYLHRHYPSTQQIDQNLELMELDSSKFKDSSSKMIQFLHTQLYRQKQLSNCPIHTQLMTIFYELNCHNSSILPQSLLFCLPILIMIDDASLQLSQIVAQIESQFDESEETVRWEMKSSDEVSIVISNKKCYHNYILKKVNLIPKINPQLQHELSLLYPLIHHYYQHPHFKQTTQLIIYWAHKKELLGYLPLSALYMLIICFFSTIGLPNIVHEFYETHREEIDKTKRRYQIGSDMEPIVDQQLYEMDLTIREMKGFYSMKENTYMKAIQIYPIPYSLAQTQYPQPQTPNPCQFFYKFIFFVNQFIKKPKVLTIDLKLKAGYSCVYSKSGFKLKVIHPVYNNELCAQMPHHLHTSLVKEVSQVISNYKGSVDVLNGLKLTFCD